MPVCGGVIHFSIFMVQKIIRTMQDDLNEVKGEKSKGWFAKKETKETALPQTKTADIGETGLQHPEQQEKDLMIDAVKAPALDGPGAFNISDLNRSGMEHDDEIRNDLESNAAEDKANKEEEERVKEKAGKVISEENKQSEEVSIPKEENDKKIIQEKVRRIEEEKISIEELKKREEELREEEERARKIEQERRDIETREMERLEMLKKREEEIRRREEEEEKKEEEEMRQTEEEAKKVELDLERKKAEIEKMEEDEKQRIADLKMKEEEREKIEKDLERKERELEIRELERKKREEMMEEMRGKISKEGNGEMEDARMEEYGQTGEIGKNGHNSIMPDNDKYGLNGRKELDNIRQVRKMETDDRFKSAENFPLQPSSNDTEFSALVKRVSGSMSKTVEKKDGPVEPQEETKKPERDKDILDIIGRMSRNLKKGKNMLEMETGSAAAKRNMNHDARGENVILVQPTISHAGKNYHEDPEKEKELQKPDSYWEDIHDTLKREDSAIPGQEAMKEIKKEIGLAPAPQPETVTRPALEAAFASQVATVIKRPEIIKPSIEFTEPQEESKEAEPEKSGPNMPQGTKESIETAIDEYTNPENRLIFGKQEFYSSLHKKVRPKTKEEKLEDLRKTVKDKEKKLSEDEEKKMLRRQIIKKYGIKLFALPWAKIIIFTILFLGAIGGSLLYVLPKFKQSPAPEVILTTGESIPELDEKIKMEVTARESQVTALNYFDGELDPWKSYSDGDIIRLKIDYDDHDVPLSRDEALKTVLGKENFENMPKDFLGLVSQKYDMLAFKNNGSLRLGVAFKFDQAKQDDLENLMVAWEKNINSDQKMQSVMRKLFLKDKITESAGATAFQPGTYSQIELKFLNLPDNNTSMDYFMHDGIIIFATSKDNTFRMIDIVKS